MIRPNNVIDDSTEPLQRDHENTDGSKVAWRGERSGSGYQVREGILGEEKP